MLFKLSVLTCFPLNTPWTYSWQLLFICLFIVIIVPDSMIILWRRTSLKVRFKYFPPISTKRCSKYISLTVLHSIFLGILPETSSSFDWIFQSFPHAIRECFGDVRHLRVIFQCFQPVFLVNIEQCSNSPYLTVFNQSPLESFLTLPINFIVKYNNFPRLYWEICGGDCSSVDHLLSIPLP